MNVSRAFFCVKTKNKAFGSFNALASSHETMEQTELHETPVTPYQLFLTFSWITLSGFGGIMFWARRRLVERERWLTEQQFVELLTLGQLLPGPPDSISP
jgi:Chromate transporter